MKKKRMKKQAIKIPEAIVRQVATELVNDLFLDWDKSLLKKCRVPSKRQLISEVIKEINNYDNIQYYLYQNIKQRILDVFKSDLLNNYDNLCMAEAYNVTNEVLLIQQVKDLGYEVKKKTNTKVRGVIK